MVRTLLVLCVLVAPALADSRAEYVSAKKELGDAYFDQLDPDKRDRLFEALAGWDNPETIPALVEVASRFGTYLSGIEGELDELHQKVSVYTDRTAIMEAEAGLRNSYLRKIHKKEAEWRRGLASQELLGKLLGSFKNPKAVNLALRTLSSHPTWRVRQLFADACRYWHKLLHDATTSRRLFSALKKLMSDKEPRVRVAVARSIGAFRRQEALDLLKGTLRDSDWRVRFAAIKALGDAKTSEAAGLLIVAMAKEKEGRLRDDINKALKEITGKDLVFADAWARWWKDVGGKLPAPGSEAGPGIAKPTAPEKKPGHRFYGIRTRSNKICYVIDVSGSMNKPVEAQAVITGKKGDETRSAGKTRIEVAKNELKRAIRSLSAKSQFTIIFFNHSLKVWRRTPVKATPANKADALKDVDAVVARGATYTLGALREAFHVAGAMGGAGRTKSEGAKIDTIFLLSDGGPTDNKLHDPKPMDPDPILDQVKQWNKDSGLTIHTIAVHTLELGTYFLRTLAGQNGGEFAERK
ncbi:MAG: HEAT repeat domain-containing protein [Planctomycetota bacterium]|jgi:hypothetical protein